MATDLMDYSDVEAENLAQLKLPIDHTISTEEIKNSSVPIYFFDAQFPPSKYGTSDGRVPDEMTYLCLDEGVVQYFNPVERPVQLDMFPDRAKFVFRGAIKMNFLKTYAPPSSQWIYKTYSEVFDAININIRPCYESRISTKPNKPNYKRCSQSNVLSMYIDYLKRVAELTDISRV